MTHFGKKVFTYQLAWIIVVGIFLVSNAMYFGQGGFGGGHGHLDLPIFLLGLPWDFLLGSIGRPKFLFAADFLWLIWIPFAINASWVVLVPRLLRRMR